jgi:predicted enzyme related to lactoylglutathione lyase
MEADDMTPEVTRLVDFGASVVERRSREPDDVWTVLQNPEGNEFCVGQRAN